MSYKNINIILLAGGKSRRMGEDKGLMLLNGKPMILHILEKIKLISENIIIVTQNPDYQQFGIKIFKDIVTDCGPMGGILTGLLASPFQKNLVLSCDIPFISEEVLKALIENCGEEAILVAQHDEKIEPLCAIYDKKCVLSLSERIEKGELKMMRFLASSNTKYLIFNNLDENTFKNFNSKKDFQSL